MKCDKCGAENPIHAKYCSECGTEFKEETREKAYQNTFWGKVESLQDKIDKILSLKGFGFVKDNKYIRLGVLGLLLGIVAYNTYINGFHMQFRNGDNYSIAYEKNADEYYILTDEESVTLKLYIPSFAKEVSLRNQEEKTEKIDLSENEEIHVERTHDGYYVLSVDYEFGKNEEIMFYVCGEDEVK